ncbi:MAG: hypothetical protein QOK37_3398 [Thermoanaerobaculia bacterium]|nr:hypothetical protein [Thermoanaerobaculia bacterium]
MAILGWVIAKSDDVPGFAIPIGAMITFAALAAHFALGVCPRCRRSLYGVRRSRCRVCGLDLTNRSDR